MKRLAIVLSLVMAFFTLGPVGVVEVASAAPPNNNCTSPVTSEMQSFVSSGGVHQLEAGGCYIVNGKLTINGTLDGGSDSNKAEIRKTSQASLGRYDGMDPTQFDGSSLRSLQQSGYCGNSGNGLVQLSGGAAIRDVHIHRTGLAVYNACHYNEHGIAVKSGPNTIQNVDIEGAWGDCVYIQGGHDLEALNVDCKSNGRQGVGLARGNDLHFDGLYIRNSDRSGFDFEANVVNDSIFNVEVENFEITNDDDALGWPRDENCSPTCFDAPELGPPDQAGPTQTGKIAFPSQGADSLSNNINIHNGIVHKALSGVYNRSSSPRTGAGGCAGRSNWRIDNVTFEGMGTSESPGYGSRTEGPTRVAPSFDTFGGPRASAMFCGTRNVTFTNNKMPGGWLTLEANSGTQIITGNCFAGVTKIGNNGPTTEGNNTIRGVNQTCGGEPPPSTTEPPAGAPDAPTIGTASTSGSNITVRWTPGDDNGSPITSYVVTASPGGAQRTVPAPATSYGFPGLTPGVSYRFSVVAINSEGFGPPSALSNAVTIPTPPSSSTTTTTTTPPAETPYQALVRRTRELATAPLPGESFGAFLVRLVNLVDEYV